MPATKCDQHAIIAAAISVIILGCWGAAFFLPQYKFEKLTILEYFFKTCVESSSGTATATACQNYPDSWIGCDDAKVNYHLRIAGGGASALFALIALICSPCRGRFLHGMLFFVAFAGSGVAIAMNVMISQFVSCSQSVQDDADTVFGTANMQPGFYLTCGTALLSIIGLGMACRADEIGENDRNNAHMNVSISNYAEYDNEMNHRY